MFLILIGSQYVHSKRFRFFSLFLGTLFVTLAALLLTALAALLGLWLGRPYVGIVLVALTAYGSKFLYQFLLVSTKTRSKGAARVAVFLSSCVVAWYHISVVISGVLTLGVSMEDTSPLIYFVNWKDVLFTNVFTNALSPAEPALFLRLGYLVNSFVRSGIPWVVYLAMILLSLLLLPQLAVSVTQQPFSEEQNRWMEKAYSNGRLQLFLPEEQELLLSSLEKGDTSLLLHRPRCTQHNAVQYSRLFFYKVNNSHSGYVGADNFFLKQKNENEYLADSYTIKPFLPPIMVGEACAKELEASLNSSAMLSFGVEDSIPGSTFHRIDSSSPSHTEPRKK